MTTGHETALLIAARQEGLITSAQCLRAGLARSDVARLLATKRWRGIFRGVHLTMPGTVSERQRIRAGLLALGPAAVAVLNSAATVHGWPVVPADPTVQVSVPADRRRLDQPGLATRQLVVDAADLTTVAGMRVTTPARTAADLLLRLPRPEAVAMLDAALGAGALTDLDLEVARMLIYGNRGAVRARRSIGDADGRAQSPLESRIRLICVDGGVPPERLQFPVYDEFGVLRALADLAWPSRGVLAEADGRAPHSTPEALLHDRRRQNLLLTRGFVVLRFTWADTRRPSYVVRTVREALEAGPRSA
ncbi:type IV toxin-antitoxin system AbiEi family antitoxin [Polymorphospora sp. NPDC051019]|uniref:type IV toxin-antitoxin system AbiEi family antitoxin n=1 Tax=Polymorphospora sp. NPDC051019 TaxID=3155725 RepID=UPI00343D04F6